MPAPTISPSAHITPNTPLLPAIKSWQFYLEDQGRSMHTVKAFMADLDLLAHFLPLDQAIGSISTDDLNHFLNWLQNKRGVPCSPKSLARRITSLKAFFRWLNQAGVILLDPAEKVIQQSVISPLPIVLTTEEVEKLISAAEIHRQKRKPDARPYTLLTLLLATGIKKGECLGISLNHIDLDNPDEPVLFIRYASAQNRYKERKILLPVEWLPAYHEYLAQYNPVDQLFPWSQRRLEYLLEDLGEEAGLDKHVSFDMCRWTCALQDINNGMEMDKIRQKLGISKIQWREIGMKLRKLSGTE
ncbi:MAG TPA: tyrosine-type recombinase/integrase [Anaerolineaceae bacterium]|nr:tyrosine-type recombinase/integrase [Anaerolineaceae bacterium]HPN52718.1 tyrosine-type recombinase/integrase [Anaerolineaceae bacterium]